MQPEEERAEDQWVTVREAAEVLGVTERTARRWIVNGKLGARKRGGHTQVNLASIDPGESEDSDLVQAATELVKATREREERFFGLMLDAHQKTTAAVVRENDALRSHVQNLEKDLRRAMRVVDEAHSVTLEREAQLAQEENADRRKELAMQWLARAVGVKVLGLPVEVIDQMLAQQATPLATAEPEANGASSAAPE